MDILRGCGIILPTIGQAQVQELGPYRLAMAWRKQALHSLGENT